MHPATFIHSVACFLVALCWLLANPFVSVSAGFKPVPLAEVQDKNLPMGLQSVFDENSVSLLHWNDK